MADTSTKKETVTFRWTEEKSRRYFFRFYPNASEDEFQAWLASDDDEDWENVPVLAPGDAGYEEACAEISRLQQIAADYSTGPQLDLLYRTFYPDAPDDEVQAFVDEELG